MKLIKRTYQIIEAKEGKRYLKMGFLNCKEDHDWFDTNLPYKKSKKDWEFYGKAVLKILKEQKK